MKRKPGSLIRQIVLPSEPSTLLAGQPSVEELETAVTDIFALFGVDPQTPEADRLLWQAMASCIFPNLDRARPQRKRGRPQAKSPKLGPQRAAEIANTWDTFVEANKSIRPQARLFALFKKRYPHLVATKKTVSGDRQHVSYSAFKKHVDVGRRHSDFSQTKPVSYYRMTVKAQVLYDAIDRAPGFIGLGNSTVMPIPGMGLYGRLLQQELLSLDTRSESGGLRLSEVEAEVRRIVPNEASYGPFKVYPFTRQQRNRSKKTRK